MTSLSPPYAASRSRALRSLLVLAVVVGVGSLCLGLFSSIDPTTVSAWPAYW